MRKSLAIPVGIATVLVALSIALAVRSVPSDASRDTANVAFKSAAPVALNPEAGGLQTQFVNVVRTVAPSVVQIETPEGLGSGVVLDTSGNIVTNAHVVGSSTKLHVTLADGKGYDAKRVGVFVQDDLAVVKISAPGLRPIAFSRSSSVRVGSIVLALGNPLGLRSSVTEGIVSAVGRTVSEGNGVALASVVQTSAAINPGNSGGALVDLTGRLVGIPTLAASDPQMGGAAPGIGFAIPSDTVRDIASQLIRYGTVRNSHRAYLGVKVGETLGTAGAYIGEIIKGGPAAKAGIKPGDVVVSIAGKPTPTGPDLSAALAGLKPGKTVTIVVRHPDGRRETVKVTLGEYPGS
jgi:putative serine protease PepD